MSPTAPSATTARSRAFVEAHRDEARALGRRLAELAGDPESFAVACRDGLAPLADPEYADGQRLVAPGIGPILGVRLPLLDAVHRAFRAGTRRAPSGLLLAAMARLLREELREVRWFAIWNLARLLPSDPERTWQLLRHAAMDADEWITVDTLAHPYGAGILLDARRWAELEQLVYSPSRWERRLVGSTIATIVFEDRHRAATTEIVQHGVELVGQLIGDDEPDVQKALSWALRSLASREVGAVVVLCKREAAAAVERGDGHRAWVVRDALPKLPAPVARELRDELAGLRRRPGSPSTSKAQAIAAEFLTALPASPAERADSADRAAPTGEGAPRPAALSGAGEGGIR